MSKCLTIRTSVSFLQCPSQRLRQLCNPARTFLGIWTFRDVFKGFFLSFSKFVIKEGEILNLDRITLDLNECSELRTSSLREYESSAIRRYLHLLPGFFCRQSGAGTLRLEYVVSGSCWFCCYTKIVSNFVAITLKNWSCLRFWRFCFPFHTIFFFRPRTNSVRNSTCRDWPH